MFKGYAFVCGLFLLITPVSSVPNEGLNDEAHQQCQHLCGVMKTCAKERYRAVPPDVRKNHSVLLHSALIDIESTCVAGCHLARIDHYQVDAGEEEDA